MRSGKAKWLSGLGVMVLIGTLVMANYGAGVPQAGAQAAPPNPLTVILDKVNQILTAIGNIPQGNPTLRWDTNNPSASRFVTAFPGAVLDKNTGLVWEQAPDATARIWVGAIEHCIKKNVGGTVGWRLPSVVEVRSVQDPTLPAPFVPASVFTGVQSDFYWSATTKATFPAGAWAVGFDRDDVSTGVKDISFHVWCVRGGMQESVY